MSHIPDMSREDRDALLTAYALDAVTPEERATVERLLADPAAAELRAHVAEVRALAAAVRAGRAADMPERSTTLRRAVLAAAVGHGDMAPAEPPLPRRRGGFGKWILALGSCAAAMLLIGLMLPARQSGREIARRPAPLQDAEQSERMLAEQSANAVAQAPGKQAQEESDGKPLPASVAAASPAPDQQGQAQRQAIPAPARRSPPPPAPAAPADSLAAGREAEKAQDFLQADRGRVGGPRLAAAGGGGAIEGSNGQAEARGKGYAGETGRALDAALDRADRDAGPTGEQYNRFADNRFLAVAEQPLSTFSIDVDTASYANVRRFLSAGRRPPRDAVRIEELVNYFRYDYPQPKGDEPFSVTLEAATCPWQTGHRIVRVGIQGRDVRRDARPAGNLVFLVDVSGSMGDPTKLPLVKQALRLLVEELSENDRVALVTYAGNAGLVLPSTSGDQKQKILAAIDALEAGGSTHGSAGITLAYEQAAERFIPGGANRVILCTDGDLNVGVTSDAALVELISQQARGGTFLTVLGFGSGNLQDEKMEKLADNGNGVYAYIDGVREARKVLVEQLTGSTITIAKDVKIQVEFNPAQVASYRLLGYENRTLTAEDFRDDKKDAGEIGAGHAVTAVYEVVLVGDEAAPAAGRGAEPLKYQPQPAPAPAPAAKPALDGPASRELLTVKLRSKKPDADTSTLTEVPLADGGGEFDAASADLRFAAAVAAFGMILRDSEHKGTATLPLVATIAGGSLGADAGGYRAEFLDLVRKAEAAR